MGQIINIFQTPGWQDYVLLDSGDGQKLERFGPYILIRPEPQAIWSKAIPKERWLEAMAEFKVTGGKGSWSYNKNIPSHWILEYKDLKFYIKLTSFRHVGIFPEQVSHWDFIQEKIKQANRPIKVLNLFGYTGITSLAAAQAGAEVTHVDASSSILAWAKENQRISGIGDKIKWVHDDAIKFLKKEVKSGERYDAVIIDPPKFGRGPKGDVWDFEENLHELLDLCRNVLSDKPLFFIASLSAVNLSAISLRQDLREALTTIGGDIDAGELMIHEKSAGRLLPLAITAIWHQD